MLVRFIRFTCNKTNKSLGFGRSSVGYSAHSVVSSGRCNVNWVRRWVTRICVVSMIALVGAGVSVATDGSATSTVPGAPTNVTATVTSTSTAIFLSWKFATTGATPDRVLVSVFNGKNLVGQVHCAYPVCTSIVVPGLVPGYKYVLDVSAGTTAGYSGIVTSNQVTVPWGCATAQVCVSVNGNTPGGAALHRAAGLLLGLNNSSPASLVAPLNIQYWRTDVGPPVCNTAGCIGYAAYNNVKRVDPTATITEVLSDNWYDTTYVANRECPSHNAMLCGLFKYPQPYGGAAMPWSNWSAFDQLTTSVVQSVESSGATVSWWDLINEPPAQTGQNDKYFDGVDSATLTASDIEQWLLHAYDDVKAADPNAKVVCPSFEQYNDYPGESPPYNQLLDFSTFLAFAAANNIDCSAFSWHEINFVGSQTDYNMQPQTIQDHVARFRALLQSYPQFAGAQIFITEYLPNIALSGSQYYETMPGWNIGDIAAIEAAGVNQSMHTCVELAGCSDQLDDLFVLTNGVAGPSDTYWPYWFYAQMNGNTVPVTSSQQEISGFATLNAQTSTIMMLLGRHDVEGKDGIPPTESTTITVDVPWSTPSVTVTSQPFADTGGVNGEPPIATSTVPVVGGVATITIPAFGSENGYGLTVQPTS
jgi:hypothetical protein